MEITEVKVFPIHEEKLKAFVSIVFDHCFMVNDIKIIQGRDGLFISMPSRKKKNGEFKDVAHPLNNETRRMIEGQVLAEYERVLDERGERPTGGRVERPSRPMAAGSGDGAIAGAAMSMVTPRRGGADPPSAAGGEDPGGDRGDPPARLLLDRDLICYGAGGAAAARPAGPASRRAPAPATRDWGVAKR